VVDGSRLLERSGQLSTLREALAASLGGQGALVLLGGEAGGGKTALLRHFCGDLPAGRVLWGGCDPLFTPRPMAPFVDIAQAAGGELHELIEAGAKPHEVAAAVTRQLRAERGTVLVLEDLHWADEATLDVLALLGRRIAALPALVVASYRDDELDRTHPLRRLLGELRGPQTIRRVTTHPLSVAAVRSLADSSGIDPEALHRTTAGNPFFVTEVLAAPGGGIPPTVRDAVLARAARLGGAAAGVVEAASIALPHAEPWLLDALAADATGALGECLDAGILEVVTGGVGFRHELARRAIEESLSPLRRLDLHRGALAALAAPPSGAPDLARLAYHAEAAGDTAAVLRFAPAAARHAASTGAYRESAAQYARALRFSAELPPDTHAELLEGRSYSCYLTDQTRDAIEALEQAIEYRRAAGDRLREGAALSQLSRRLWCGGRSADAAKVGLEALHLLEALPAGRELALAYSNIAQLRMNDEQFDETVGWATRAIDLAEPLGELAVTAHSLNNIGTVELLAGIPDGMDKLARSMEIAQQAGLEEHVGRAFIHVGWAITRTRAYAHAPWLDRGVKVCEDLGLEGWKAYVVAYRARYRLDRGQWDEAAADATHVLAGAHSVPMLRILALTVLGLIRARRGDPGHREALDDALALLDGQQELQYQAPVALARAEAAWLDGRGRTVDGESADTLALAAERGAAWVVGELAWLRRLAGLDETVTGVIEPYAAQLAGDATGAERHWTRLGCPYDAALALLASDDEDDLRRALAELQRLGARPAAAVAARRLREHGVRGLPRGPQPETRGNPAQLTRREIQVLELVRQGASNAEIAARLFLSEKTVGHHVSAILRKLGVTSRTQAAAAATRLELSPRPTP
jgi:DNA-binding CsgD family transcriptional regulator/tetratricopeptide (TPR) repeat protein